jgi:3',5'-cyclic AMP phosphodiesterase CpdA
MTMPRSSEGRSTQSIDSGRPSHFLRCFAATASFGLLILLIVGSRVAIGNQAGGPAQSDLDAAHSTGRVTFVQMTDPHIFDAGGARHAEGVEEEALDNREAFHWAVLETNRLVLAEHRMIDFVVITGDFGLENVTLPMMDKLPGVKKCDCPKRAKGKEGPIVAVPLREAASEVARELDALLVKRVYLVPGNNDLCDESPRDLHRWAEFVFALKDALKDEHDSRDAALKASYPTQIADTLAPEPPEVVDLTYSLQELYAAKNPRILPLYPSNKGPGKTPDPPNIHGFYLLGLDSAFFKPHKDAAVQALSDKVSSDEITSLKKRIRPGGSYLIFTHIPDVEDPHKSSPGSTKGDVSTPDRASSWKLPGAARKTWHDLLGASEVIAVFSGHFHESRRDIYPHNFDYAKVKPDDITSQKMWVAPPLAAKYQWNSPQGKTARGILLVTVTANGAIRVSSEDGDGVKAEPIWFSNLEQKAAVEGDDLLAQARDDERDGHWDTAAALYARAMTSSDPRTRTDAEQGYSQDRQKMRTWWWQTGRYFPPLRWCFSHPLRSLIGWGIIFVILLGRLIRKRVVIYNPEQLTTGSPAIWLGSEMQNAGTELAQRFKREGLAHQVGGRFRGSFVLAGPSSAFDSVVGSLPDVHGVDAKGLAKFLLSVWQYFGWRAESGLAVSSTTVTGLTVRRWTSVTRGSWRASADMGQPPVGAAPGATPDATKALTQVARDLAYHLAGVPYSKDL